MESISLLPFKACNGEDINDPKYIGNRKQNEYVNLTSLVIVLKIHISMTHSYWKNLFLLRRDTNTCCPKNTFLKTCIFDVSERKKIHQS